MNLEKDWRAGMLLGLLQYKQAWYGNKSALSKAAGSAYRGPPNHPKWQHQPL